MDNAKDTLSIPISRLELSIRTRKFLDKLEIKTIGELTHLKEIDFLICKPAWGETMVCECKEILRFYGLALQEIKKTQPDKDIIDFTIYEFDFTVRVRKTLEALAIKTVKELVKLSETDLCSCQVSQSVLWQIKRALTYKGLSLREDSE